MRSTCVCLISDVTVAPADALSEVSLPVLSSSSAGLGERGADGEWFCPTRGCLLTHTNTHPLLTAVQHGVGHLDHFMSLLVTRLYSYSILFSVKLSK